jgi:hypothetical protein
MKRRAGMAALALALLAATTVVQHRLTDFKDETWIAERMSSIPRSDKVKSYMLGYETVYAQYLWIRTMLYFGEHYDSDRDFRWLVSMVDMVTRLNPRFYPAYEFAGLMLPRFGNAPDVARVILQRGIFHLGADHYKLAFYLGWLHYQQYRDYDRAAEYLSLAGTHPDAPFFRRAGKSSTARAFLASVYQAAENPMVRRAVAGKMAHLPTPPDSAGSYITLD